MIAVLVVVQGAAPELVLAHVFPHSAKGSERILSQSISYPVEHRNQAGGHDSAVEHLVCCPGNAHGLLYLRSIEEMDVKPRIDMPRLYTLRSLFVVSAVRGFRSNTTSMMCSVSAASSRDQNYSLDILCS